MLKVALIGAGAIGSEVLRRLEGDAEIRVTYVLTRSRESDCPLLPAGTRQVCSVGEMEEQPDFALECAGASAIGEHVVPLLRRGVDVAISSIGAFIDEDLVQRASAAARAGGSQVHLLAGAVGGIDAIASARLLGLDAVALTSRKPPAAWVGTPAESMCDLRNLTQPMVLFHGCARQAAGLYPKNANVAATVALAGLGLDTTMVTLVADPSTEYNTHEIEASGAFGEMRYATSNRPLANHPKTSALVALSALRMLRNQTQAIAI